MVITNSHERIDLPYCGSNKLKQCFEKPI